VSVGSPPRNPHNRNSPSPGPKLRHPGGSGSAPETDTQGMNEATNRRNPVTDRTTKALLAAIAVLLGLNVVGGDSAALPGPAQAHAQESRPGGALISAATQRKQMVEELRRMNTAIQGLEARLSGPLNVKVTDMPEIKLPREQD